MYKRDPKTNKQLYPLENGQRVYLKDEFGTEVFAENENGVFYYNTDNSGQEFYPKVFGAVEFTNQIRYIKEDGDEKYPTSKDKNGLIADCYDEVLGYAKNRHNNQIYAKNKFGQEYPFNNTYAKYQDNTEYYPLRDGSQYYLQDSSGNDILAKRFSGDEYYATHQRDAIYPQNLQKQEFYAKTSEGKEIYKHGSQYF